MRKLVWLLLIVVVLVSSMLLVANVHASTPVSGIITSNTTWTEANSPYILTGSITVNTGVTLTIEPGVTVDLVSYSIMVGGTLNSAGTSDNKIIFQTSYSYSNIRVQFLSTSMSWNPTAGSGCIVDNAIFNSVSISVSGCSPKINNNYFTNNQYTSITVSGGSPLIVNNAFDTRGTCITTNNGYSGSPVISGNFIKCSVAGNFGIGCGNNVYVSDNNITGCYIGVYAIGNATITRNLITANTYGMMTTVGTATVENNTFASNSFGISGGGTIRNNTFGNNQIGLTESIANSIVTQNNFFGNTQYNLRLSLTTAVDATYNWWGTTDASAINQTIYDNKNNTLIGTVNFAPFLNGSNPQAPTLDSVNYIPVPTPTPYPTTVPAPTITPYPTTHPTQITNFTIITPTPSPLPTAPPTAIPTPTPLPTPSPTAKIMPGSPLTLGGSTFAEVISQLDIVGLAKLVLIALGIMWVIIILVSVDRKFGRKTSEKQ